MQHGGLPLRFSADFKCTHQSMSEASARRLANRVRIISGSAWQICTATRTPSFVAPSRNNRRLPSTRKLTSTKTRFPPNNNSSLRRRHSAYVRSDHSSVLIPSPNQVCSVWSPESVTCYLRTTSDCFTSKCASAANECANLDLAVPGSRATGNGLVTGTESDWMS